MNNDKRDIRPLPLTDAEFEADFFFDPRFSSKRREVWKGMIIEREFGALLAMGSPDGVLSGSLLGPEDASLTGC